ncbi:hypothetical protein KP509_20G030100 [Ceratopteris richardii]|uniref:Uncharacterized protein n=1 Tax=Ceratopteris richardii TaxID=49495 RepID=A0A8T2SHY9_CERRI|nr:hypothetical protein KP509_20G030100 [Ceratopteris richardii]
MLASSDHLSVSTVLNKLFLKSKHQMAQLSDRESTPISEGNNLTSVRGDQPAHYVDESHNHEGHVSEAVVPFSWEMKPGVPLDLSSKLNFVLMESSTKRKSGPLEPQKGSYIMLKETKQCKNAMQEFCTEKHTLLFPLPLPPSFTTPNHGDAPLVLENNQNGINASSVPSSSVHNRIPGASLYDDPMSESKPGSNSKGYTIKPSRKSSFPVFSGKNVTSNRPEMANTVNDDPFMRAIDACTQSKNAAYHDEPNFLIKKSSNSSDSMKNDAAGGVIFKSCGIMTANGDTGTPRGNDICRKTGGVGPVKASSSILPSTAWDNIDNSEDNGRSVNRRLYEGIKQAQKVRQPSVTKPTQYRSSGSYGCMGCRSEGSSDSIIRIHNYN